MKQWLSCQGIITKSMTSNMVSKKNQEKDEDEDEIREAKKCYDYQT